ncbi:MAG: glutamate-5-semialdehyde dehydrogenase [Ruminococcaceae bacterium]|nr:glutamate-5-semialdehyde dehydrogenase [Oscillospiraceae bacterium]
MKLTSEILKEAKEASLFVNRLSTEEKNAALEEMAKALLSASDEILAENEKDLEAAKGSISDVMLDRLRLTPQRIEGMVSGIRALIALPDPVGTVLDEVKRENGLLIRKISCPLGVVGIIYESRPNVTADAASLAIKSGNACVLRGGKEAFRSSFAIVKAMRTGLARLGIPCEAISLIEDTTRASSMEMMKAEGYLDMLIPRGGAGLIRACVENATVPCIQTGTGICHVYVDSDADLEKALNIIENAKTSRPSVCNAAEVLLVAESVAEEFLPLVEKRLVTDRASNPVELRLCPKAAKIISGTPAGEKDFDTEFLDYILAVRVVKDVQEACEHIRAHSTGHSEAIVTESEEAAEYFTAVVDSTSVYVNASTRFTDGGEFGLGCEMGISTQKLHARGPMGLRELCTYKYIVRGNGTVR